jgi:hypothetical protein
VVAEAFDAFAHGLVGYGLTDLLHLIGVLDFGRRGLRFFFGAWLVAVGEAF